MLARPPAAPASINPSSTDVPAGTPLARVYAPEPYKTEPTTFREFGPINRFDHHRAAADGSRRRDDDRGILYAAEEFTCGIGEYFTDQGAITLSGNKVARLTVIEDLRVLDLRGTAATGVGTIQAIGGDGKRSVTQAWARYLYEHPDLGNVDGLLYQSATTGLDALALWERAQDKLLCLPDDHWELADLAVYSEVLLAGTLLHLPVVA